MDYFIIISALAAALAGLIFVIAFLLDEIDARDSKILGMDRLIKNRVNDFTGYGDRRG